MRLRGFACCQQTQGHRLSPGQDRSRPTVVCRKGKVRKGKVMGSNTEIIEIVNKENLGAVWERVYSLVKLITGDVDIKNDGTLQDQIKGLKEERNLIRDETTNQRYRIGVENGWPYIQEVDG